MSWVVGPQYFRVIPWHFENGASIKIDDVLAEDGGLLHVLPLTVHLLFFDGQVVGPFRNFLTVRVFCGTPPSCLKIGGGWWPTGF